MRRRFPVGVLVAVAAGGAAGTLVRALVAQALPPPAATFPWDTLIVNVGGSFVLGLVVVAAIERAAPSRYLRPLVGTGLCGGVTTFSTFVVETDLLLRAGRIAAATGYVALSVAGGLVAARVGTVLARSVWRREDG